MYIYVLRYTSSSLAFAMNATDHIKVAFLKFAYSLMSRVIVSPNSIVTAIVNSYAYHQSPLMDKRESMLYVKDWSSIELSLNMSMCDEWPCDLLV